MMRRRPEDKNGSDGADDDEEESSESTVTSVQPEDKNGADGADDDDEEEEEESSESTVTSEQTYQAGCFIISDNAKFTTVTIESAAKVCIPASATIGKVVNHGKLTIQDHCDASFCEGSDGEDGSD